MRDAYNTDSVLLRIEGSNKLPIVPSGASIPIVTEQLSGIWG